MVISTVYILQNSFSKYITIYHWIQNALQVLFNPFNDTRTHSSRPPPLLYTCTAKPAKPIDGFLKSKKPRFLMPASIFWQSKTHLCYDLHGIYVLFKQRFPRAQLDAVRHRVGEREPVQVRRRHVVSDQMDISLLDRTLSINKRKRQS